MADFNNPLSSQAYTTLLASIGENNKAALTMLEGVTTLTNLPTTAKRWSPTNNKWESWDGTAWGDLTALFEMKVRNADQLNGQTEAFYRSASNLNAGTLPAAQFNDTAHGARAGGTLHANASGTAAGFMSVFDFGKLSGIEAGSKDDQTPSEILTALLSVDGPGSGLNADLLDSLHANSFALVSNLGSLAYKNTAADSDLDNPGAYKLITPLTASNSSELVFNASIDSTYDEYYCELSGLLNATDAVGLRMQISTDLGLNFKSGASDYKTLARVTHTGPGDVVTNNNNSFMELTSTQGISNNTSIGGIDGYIRFSLPSNATRYFKITWDYTFYASNGQLGHSYGTAMYQATTAINAFKIYMSAGVFSEGTAKLYGLKKS